ncbi:MFS transporter small subunit [Nocardioides sp. LML1-1-1.1]
MTEQTHDLGDQRPRVVAAWVVVGIPLGYGLVETIRSALNLFSP